MVVFTLGERREKRSLLTASLQLELKTVRDKNLSLPALLIENMVRAKNLEKKGDDKKLTEVVFLRELKLWKQEGERIQCENKPLRQTEEKVLNSAIREAGTFLMYVGR